MYLEVYQAHISGLIFRVICLIPRFARQTRVPGGKEAVGAVQLHGGKPNITVRHSTTWKRLAMKPGVK